jgi:hypothetical protein
VTRDVEVYTEGPPGVKVTLEARKADVVLDKKFGSPAITKDV